MSFEDIAPREAHERLSAEGSEWRYVDVRSEPEFEAGHPQGAVNIPIFHLDPMTQQMRPNEDFVKVVSASFEKSQPLVLGCQKGGRSARAAQVLSDAGFEKLANMVGGYGGLYDESGLLVQEGWEAAGLPVSEEAEPGATYAELREKA